MKLLLIMPNFFDYPQVIVDELNQLGYDVDYFDDRPSTNTLVKAIVRINRKLINKYIKNYFKKVMSTVHSKQYDVVLLISGQSLSFSENMIRMIKDSQPKAKFVLYQWDSLKNFRYIEKMHKYFDKCYSFDRYDCAENEELLFLPLFYSKSYEEIGKKKIDNYKYDICFVGTAHPQKYKFIKHMSKQLKEIYPNQFIYFFFPSRLVFFYRKLRNSELRNAHYSEFNYHSLSEEEMRKLFLQSACILDSSQEGQTGLTIRVIEALGAKKKIITTNADIKQYDFFKEENIYIYDGSFDMNSRFFNSEYTEMEKDVYDKYSLRNWLKVILE